MSADQPRHRPPLVAIRHVDIMYFYTACSVREFYRPTRESYAVQREATEVGGVTVPGNHEA